MKAKLRVGRQMAAGPNDVWAMDFVHDQLATGKKIRVLTIVDTFSRYVPALGPRFSYRARDVVRTLEQICPVIGYPGTIRVDQGTKFASRDLDPWAYAKGVTPDVSRPGKPTDNAYIEAFNGRFRAECLNQHCFSALADAAEELAGWRRDDNEERPHGRSGTRFRSRSSIPPAPPARRRDEARKLQLLQASGADHFSGAFKERYGTTPNAFRGSSSAERRHLYHLVGLRTSRQDRS